MYRGMSIKSGRAFATTLLAILLMTAAGAAAPAYGAFQVEFTQQSTSLAIGEPGTWQVTVNKTGTTPENANLVVTFPGGFTVTDAGGGTENSGPPHTLTWNFGSITSPGTRVATFSARPNCKAGTGESIRAQVNPTSGPTATSSPISVALPQVNVTLLDGDGDTVADGSVGDMVTWYLTVANTGSGDLFHGANVTFTLGSAFEFVSITSLTGHNTPDSPLQPGTPRLWNTGLIVDDSEAVYEVKMRINGCNSQGLVNQVAINWQDGAVNCLAQPRTASSSVALVIREPIISITPHDPGPISYCDGGTATISIANLDGQGPATSFDLQMEGLPSDWEITPLNEGVTFDTSTNTFEHIPTIPVNGTFDLRFQIKPKAGVCPPAPDATLIFRPKYDNECGETYGTVYFPPVTGPVTWSLGSPATPTFTVQKTGPATAVLGQTGLSYTITVTYSGSTDMLPYTVDITDDYPDVGDHPYGFTVTDPGGGDDNDTVIKWRSVTFNPNDLVKTFTVVMDPPAGDPCAAFHSYTNNVTVSSVPDDCRGCPGVIRNATFSTFITDTSGDIVKSSSVSLVSDNDVCSNLQYRTCYTTGSGAPTAWNGMSLNNEITPAGLTPIGIDKVEVNGVDYIGSCGSSFPLDLACLDVTAAPIPNSGPTLCVTFSYSVPDAPGDYEVHSSLTMPPGYGSGCVTSPDYDVASTFTVTGSSMTVNAYNTPAALNACETRDYKIDIGGTRTLYDADVTLNTMGNYRYLNTVGFTNVEDSSGNPISAFEPTSSGDGNYTWDFGADLKPQGTITFRMQQVCGEEGGWSASGRYNNKCSTGNEPPTRAATPNPDIEAPLTLRSGLPTLHLVPVEIFAASRFPVENLYVVNGGSGPMYNTALTLRLAADLDYQTHAVSIGPAPDNVTISSDKQTITFFYNEIPAGAQRALTVTDQVIGCDNLTITATVTWGCDKDGDGTLDPCGTQSSKTSRVLLPTTELLVVEHSGTPIDYCNDQNGTMRIAASNRSKVDVFNVKVRELLPPGVTYVATTGVTHTSGYGNLTGPPTVTVENNYENTGRQRITWDFSDVLPLNGEIEPAPAMKPGSYLAVEFKVAITSCETAALYAASNKKADASVNFDPPCNFDKGNSTLSSPARVFFTEPGNPQVTIGKEGRNVTKGTTTFTNGQIGADPGDVIEWRLNISSTGSYPAKDVTVTDLLPSNITYVADSGHLDGGSTPLPNDWYTAGYNLGTIPVGTNRIILFRTTVDLGECGALTTNQASVSYGCCASPALETVTSNAVKLATQPDFSTSGGAFTLNHANWTTCGGRVTITFKNSGSTALTQNITDTLPAGYVFDPSGGSCTVTSTPSNSFTHPSGLNCTGVSGNTPTWNSSNIDQIFPGETITITYYVKAEGEYCDNTKDNDGVDPADIPIPNLTNRVDYSYQDPCGNAFTPYKTGSINPTQPDIDITKTPDQQTVPGGGRASWSITLTNKGDAPASNVTLTDVLGDGFSNITSSPAGTWNQNTGSWTIPGPISANGGTYLVTVQADVGSGSLANHATTQGMCKDRGGANTCTYSHDEKNAYTAGFQLAKSVDKATANIGEELTYTLTATFLNTETFKGVTLVDTLPPDTYYVSATQNGGDFSVAPTQNGQVLTWNLDDFNGPKQFSFLVKVRIKNVSANTSGRVLTNSLQANFGIDFDGDGTADKTFTQSRTATTTLTEPKLSIDKTISPDAGIAAGSQVTVTLIVRNTGSGPAYRVNVGDLLNDTNNDGVVDANDATVYDCGTIVQSGDGTEYPSGFIASVTGNAPGCRVGYVADGNNTIEAGGMRTFKFNVDIAPDVTTGSVFTDMSTVKGWNLKPSDPEAEDQAYDRPTSGSDTYDITIESTSLMAKVITATSEPSTPGASVAIGEVVTYRLPFLFPAGTTPNVTIGDELPAGLKYIPGTAMLDRDSDNITMTGNPGGINVSAPGVPVPVTLATVANGVELALGDVSSQKGSHRLFLSLQCVVKNVATSNNGSQLKDRPRLRWEDGSGQTYHSAGDWVTVAVVEPDPTIEKTASPLSGEGGDTITFTVKLCNQGTTSAFDWIFRDPLPSYFASPQVIEIDTSEASEATASHCSGQSGYFSATTLCGMLDRVDAGHCVTVRYSAVLTAGVVFGQTLENTATFTTTSLPGGHGTDNATSGSPGTDTGERTGSGTGPNDLRGQDSTQGTISVPSMTKTVEAPRSWYAIGDMVYYRITVGVPSGSTSSFVVKDVLPTGLVYVEDSALVTVPDGFTSEFSPDVDWNGTSRTVTWNFGDISLEPPAADVIITYRARVQNILANQDGTTLTNNASLTYGTPAQTITSTRMVTVGEPNLFIQKTPQTTPVDLMAGSTVRYRVEFRNNGHTTAYQAAWEEVLPFVSAPNNGLGDIDNLTLSIVNGSVTHNGTVTAITVADLTVSDLNSSNDKISLPPFQMAPGSSFWVEFDCKLLDGVSAGTFYTNTTAVAYTSQPTAGLDVRDGSGGPNVDDDNNSHLNNYRESAQHSLLSNADIDIEKSLPDGRDRYAVGETYPYRLRVWVVQGESPKVVVTDTLPPGTSYLGHQVLVPQVGGILLGQQDFVLNGQDLTFDFGDVTNSPDAGCGPKDYFDIEIRVRVDNAIANQDGTELENSGKVGFEPGGSHKEKESNTVTTRVIEPTLVVEKHPVPGIQSRGNLVTYEIVVSHDNSTADAYDLILTDTLPADLIFVSTTASDYTQNGQELTFRHAALALGQTWTFTYTVRVSANADLASQPMLNGVVTTWTSTPGATGGSASGRTGSDGLGELNDYTDNTQAPVRAAAPDLHLAKSDGNVTVDSGDSVKYTLSYENRGNWPATGVVLTETVPAYTTFDNDNSTAGWTCSPDINAGSTCTFQPESGVLVAGAQGSVVFAVKTVRPFPADVELLNNQARLTDDGKNGPDGNPGDENATDQTLVNAAPDLMIEKSDLVNVVVPGQQLIYSLTVTNVGDQDAAGVVVRDVLPAGTSFVGASNGGAQSSPGVITWPPFSLGGGGASATRTVTVRVNDPIPAGIESISNLATVSHPQDSNATNDEAVDTDEVNAAPDLAITKSDGVSVAGPGSILTYTLKIINIGNQNAAGVTVTDAIPAATVFLEASGDGQFDLNTRIVTWPPFDLPGKGGVTARTVTVQLLTAIPAGLESISNVAVVSHPDDTNSANNQATDTDLVKSAPDLTVTKTDGLTEVKAGDEITYTLTVRNIGNQNANNVKLTDRLPSNSTFVGASDGGAETSPGSGVVAWPLFSLTAGGTVSYTVTVGIHNPLPAGYTSLVNRAEVRDGEDSNPNNNSATDTDLIRFVDLQLTKRGFPGRIMRFVLSYRNNGNATATGVEIREAVPEHTTFVKASSTAGWSCDDGAPAGTMCRFPVGAVAPRQRGSVTFTVAVDASFGDGVIKNTASVHDDGSYGQDPTPGNNASSASTSTRTPPGPNGVPTITGWGSLIAIILLCSIAMALKRKGRRNRVS